MAERPHVWLFTDGSCTGSDVGAWASLVVIPGHQARTLFGIERYTTINRCELLPIIAGLRLLWNDLFKGQPGIRVAVVSDSETTVRMLGGDFSPGANYDLWQELKDNFLGWYRIVPIWRARNSHPYMQYADMVASTLRRFALNPAKAVDNETPRNDIPVEELLL